MLPMSLPPHQAQPSPLRPCFLSPSPTTPIYPSTFLPPPTSSTGVKGRGRRRALSTTAVSIRMGVSSSKWWWQQALGQRFNREGAASFLSVAVAEPHLALPHLTVPDIRWVDWPALRRLGFRGVVFDKDNTLTAPYSLAVWPPIYRSLCLCRSSFPAGSIAVFSNSAGALTLLFYFFISFCCNFMYFQGFAGLEQYDPDGTEAKALEEEIGGIHVIKHGKYFVHLSASDLLDEI